MSKHKNNRALTLIEVLIVFLIVGIILIVIIQTQQYGPHEISKRLVCGANVKGINTVMKIHAEGSNYATWYQPPDYRSTYYYDIFPGGGDGTESSPDRTMPIPCTSNGIHLSPTRVFWNSIRVGDAAPMQFICPFSSDTVDPTVDFDSYYDFTSSEHVSYGYNISLFYQDATTISRHASYIPVVAEKSPYSSKQTPVPSTLIIDSNDINQWSPYNSPNNGKGQNVLYADGHVCFEKCPIVGVDLDNIYTTAASCTDPNPLLTGVSMWTARNLPYDWYDPKHNPYAATDALIFP